jgi:hypothetical protein
MLLTILIPRTLMRLAPPAAAVATTGVTDKSHRDPQVLVTVDLTMAGRVGRRHIPDIVPLCARLGG